MAAGLGGEAPRHEAGVAHCTVRARTPSLAARVGPSSPLLLRKDHDGAAALTRLALVVTFAPHNAVVRSTAIRRRTTAPTPSSSRTPCPTQHRPKVTRSHTPRTTHHARHTHLGSLVACRGAPVPEKSVADIEDFQAKINTNPTAENFPLVARTPPAHMWPRLDRHHRHHTANH